MQNLAIFFLGIIMGVVLIMALAAYLGEKEQGKFEEKLELLKKLLDENRDK